MRVETAEAVALQRIAFDVAATALLPLWLLGNIYEHWDELRRLYRAKSGRLEGTALKLRTEFPMADPWSLTFDAAAGEIVLADMVPLNPFASQLSRSRTPRPVPRAQAPIPIVLSTRSTDRVA